MLPAGTPYKNPGGRWSKFKTYSVWQRTCEIWSFAFSFAWKYLLVNQAWTYKGGKKGMTPEAISARKKELAIWLREGLVKLGVSGGGWVAVGVGWVAAGWQLAVWWLGNERVCGGSGWGGRLAALGGSLRRWVRWVLGWVLGM